MRGWETLTLAPALLSASVGGDAASAVKLRDWARSPVKISFFEKDL